MGLGESRLHLEGKRRRDINDHDKRKRKILRENREAKLPETSKIIKAEAKRKRQVKMDDYSSINTVANLCSGDQKCCAANCLKVCAYKFTLKFSHRGSNLIQLNFQSWSILKSL